MRTLLAVIVASIIAIVVSPNVSANLIENGGFENDFFEPWQYFPTSEASWTLNNRDNPIDPPGPGSPLAPIEGNQDAKSTQTKPGSSWLRQAFTVPTGAITSATLSWRDRIENYAGFFEDGVQEFRVELFSTSATDPFVEEIFSTNRPDYTDPPVQIGPTFRSFDVLSILQDFEGQSLTLSFEEYHVNYFNITLDDVSLEIGTAPVPEPATLLLLGSGLIGLTGYSRCRRRRK